MTATPNLSAKSDVPVLRLGMAILRSLYNHNASENKVAEFAISTVICLDGSTLDERTRMNVGLTYTTERPDTATAYRSSNRLPRPANYVCDEDSNSEMALLLQHVPLSPLQLYVYELDDTGSNRDSQFAAG